MERLECQLQETIKAKRKLEKKFDQATARLSKAENEICEEKEMNKYLRENQRELREKVERENAERERRHREEVQDLTDQVRDLMFYVETQQKMEKASDEQKQELQDGQIVVEAPSDESKTKVSGHSKGRKSKKRK
jgi:BRCA1-associated protein